MSKQPKVLDVDAQGYITAHSNADGDITLISEDDKKFRVHSYMLKTFSTVFRDMLSMPDFDMAQTSPTPISASNSEIVLDISASDIAVFLDLAQKGKADSDVTLAQWARLVDFGQKYDCQTVLRCTSAELMSKTKSDPWLAFCLAGQLGEPHLAEKAILDMSKSIQTVTYTNRGNARFVRPLTMITWEQWKKCPPEYLFALVRSIAVDEKGVLEEKYSWNGVSALFADQLPVVRIA